MGKALAAVGDGHSFFATPAQVNWHKQQAQTNASQPSGCIVEGRIGYIQIPAFSALSIKEMIPREPIALNVAQH